MRKWFYISFFFIQHLLGHAYAQTTAVKPKPISQNLRAIQLQAEREYKASHFETAITLYKSYFKRINFIDTTAVFNVAESYRLSKQFDSAMVYFQKLSNWHPRYLPNLAELYATVGNYSKSIETYKSIVPTDSNQLKKIEARIIGFKGREDFQIDSLDWKLTSSKINSNGNESNPVRYKDGIAYTAAPISRKNGAVDQAQPVLLYAPDSIATSPSVAKIDSTKNKKQIKQPKKRIAIDITSRNSIDNSTLRKPVAKPKPVVREEVSSIDPFLQKIISGGPIQFSITGDTVYYAQSVRLKDKKSKLGIFYAVKSNNQWKEKDEITAGYTSSTFHPSASKDGRKIYFVIDSKDGFGGPDLYFVERMGDTAWSSPTNAGPYVNSPGNELFPTIIGDSLYFSTNGRGGLGGQDIFVVQLDKNEVPTNLGFPINSSYDDYGIVFNDARSGGYVSSNRNGSGDIYAFNFKKVFYRTGGTINYASDNTIASREQVYLVDTKTEKTVDSTITDDLGNYYFNLRPNRLYRIEQREDGLSKGSYVVNTKEPVYLDSTLLAKRIQTDSAAVVVAESQPVDTAAVAILQRIADIDSLVVLEKDLITTKLAIQQLQKDSLLLTQQSSTIDTVSTETASTVVRKMLIQSQLRELKSDLSRLEYKKFELSLALQPPKDIVQINSTKPVEKIKINIQLPGVSPKQKADSIAYVIQQRLIKQKEEEELLLRGDQLTRFNVYFGFSKFNLNLIEQKILDSTIKVLKANPNLFAVMGSFTDCSGPIDFNIRLSAKRSAAVIKYLIQNGVDKSRIRENHYGKNYLVQNCSPKRYSSRQQLLNRRTEIYLTNDKSLAWTDLAADTTKKYSVYTALGKKLSDFVSLKTVYVTAKKLKVDSSQLIVKAKGQERREKGEEKQPVAQPITKNLQPTTVKQDSVLIVKDQPKPALQKQIVKKDTTVSIVKKVPEVKKDSVVIVKAQPSTVNRQQSTANRQQKSVDSSQLTVKRAPIVVKQDTLAIAKAQPKSVPQQPITKNLQPTTVKQDSVVIVKAQPSTVNRQQKSVDSSQLTVRRAIVGVKVDTIAIAKVEIKGEGEREKREGKQPVAQPKTYNVQPTPVKQDSVVIVKIQPKPAPQEPKTYNIQPTPVKQDTIAIAKVEIKGEGERDKREGKQPIAQPKTYNLQPTTVKQDTVAIVKVQPKPAPQKPTTNKLKPAVVKEDTVSIAKDQPKVQTPKPSAPSQPKQLTQEEEDRITREELLAALDSLAKLRREQERIVEYLTKRINKKPIEVFTYADSVTVEIFDSGIHDKDSVSVIFNKTLVVDKHELKVDRPIKFKVRVDKDRRNNEMVIVAENLGTYPPNTAVMIITDKFGKHEEIMLSTDLTTNEVVIFIRIDKQDNSNPTKNQP